MKQNKFGGLRFLHLALAIVLFTYLGSSKALACDTCSGHNPGDTWSASGRNYRCNSCSNVACTSGGVPNNRCEVQGSGGICDNSCPVGTPGKYTTDIGAATPTCTGLTSSQLNFTQDTGSYTLTVSGVTNSASVYIYVWSLLNNRDDMTTLVAVNQGGGTWRATEDIGLHPTNQGNNTIVADAYIDGPAGVGRFCGSVIGSMHKATPPTARLDFTWDTTGFSIRDAFVNINDLINIADFPQSVIAISNDPNTGNPQNGMSSMLVARRACDATNGFCTPNTGGWINWAPAIYNCPYGADTCGETTTTWTPTWADMATTAKYQAVVNGYDKMGFSCSGNAPTAATSPLDSPYARCDRFGGEWDRVNIYLNAVPKGFISNGFLLNGVAQATRSISITAGDIITLTANGTDNNIDDIYAPNYVTDIRILRSHPVFPVTVGLFTCPVGSASCTNTFTINTAGLPVGTYEYYLQVNDNVKPCNSEYNGGSWYARSIAYHYRCDRNGAANYSTSNDALTVTVGPPKYTVSGSSFLTTIGCTPRVGGPGLSTISTISASSTVPVNTYPGVPSGTNWSVSQIPQGTPITSLTSQMNPSGSYTYRLTCVDLDGVDNNGNEYSVVPSANSITLPSVLVNGNIAGWRLGFAEINLASWVQVMDGDVYSSGGLNVTVPGAPAGGFNSFFMSDTDSLNGSGFIISNSAMSSNSMTQNNGGRIDLTATYASNLWPASYPTTVPTACASNTLSKAQLNAAIDPSRCYFVTTAVFNDWADDAGIATYDLSSSNSVAIIYIGDSGTLHIARTIRSIAVDERILFVAARNLEIDPTLGDAVPSASGGVNLGLGIISLGSNTVTVTSQNPTDDTTFSLNGFLYSNAGVDLRRNRQVSNVYPSTYVRFNGHYIYGLTARERAAATENASGLFVSNISWIRN